MESRVLILIVWASLVQGASVQNLTIPYGLSEKEAAVVNEIIANQETVIKIYSDVIDHLFDVLSNRKAKTDDGCPKVVGILSRLTSTLDLVFDSVLKALRNKSCSGVDVTRKAAYDYLDDASTQITAGIKLAPSGSFSETCDEIEERHAATMKDISFLTNGFYNFVTGCLQSTEPDVLAVIDSFRSASLIAAVHSTNGTFNAIKVRAARFHSKCGDREFTSDMEEFRNKVSAAVMVDIEFEFSLLRTLYMYFKLNKRGIVTKLAANQYAATVSNNRWKMGNAVVHGTILRYMKRIQLQLTDDGRLDYSLDDLDAAKIIAYYNAGDASNLNSILVLQPESSTAIAAARERIFAVNALGSSIHLMAIQQISSKIFSFDEIVNRLKALSDGVNALAPSYTGDYFSVIRSNRSFNAKQEADLRALQKAMIDATVYATDRFLDMALIFATATYSGKVSSDDFSSLEALLDASNFGTAKYDQAISAAGILVMLADDTS